METIQEKNRAILSFMGIKPRMDGPWRYSWSDGVFFVTSGDTPEEVMDNMANYAKYHSDWNWLMSVVEKMTKMDYEVNIYGSNRVEVVKDIEESIDGELIFECAGSPKILSVHHAVFEFIKWYNQKANN